MRICSLLPSATEIVYALGLGDQLVAVTHECDQPADARTRPRITRSAIDPATLTSAQIDALVTEHRHEHRGIYHIDRDLLERLNPDLILTQELCDVCAVSYDEVQRAVRSLDGERHILSLEPATLGGVLETIEVVGRATGTESRATEVVAGLRARIARVRERTAAVTRRPRVACLEWLDPPFTGGHWVPELVEAAGGEDPFGRPGEPSRRLPWDEVLAAEPEVAILMPCGFGVERALAEYRQAAIPPGWAATPAVRAGRVWAVDANSHFSRPGPRLVDGLEALAAILHPELFPDAVEPAVAHRVEASDRPRA
jgi:iron complex transport system substrate-binding protein